MPSGASVSFTSSTCKTTSWPLSSRVLRRRLSGGIIGENVMGWTPGDRFRMREMKVDPHCKQDCFEFVRNELAFYRRVEVIRASHVVPQVVPKESAALTWQGVNLRDTVAPNFDEHGGRPTGILTRPVFLTRVRVQRPVSSEFQLKRSFPSGFILVHGNSVQAISLPRLHLSFQFGSSTPRAKGSGGPIPAKRNSLP
jgi:hypothetical protein